MNATIKVPLELHGHPSKQEQRIEKKGQDQARWHQEQVRRGLPSRGQRLPAGRDLPRLRSGGMENAHRKGKSGTETPPQGLPL